MCVCVLVCAHGTMSAINFLLFFFFFFSRVYACVAWMAVCVCMRAPVHFVGLQSATFTQQGRFNSLLSKKLLISAASSPHFFFHSLPTWARLADKRRGREYSWATASRALKSRKLIAAGFYAKLALAVHRNHKGSRRRLIDKKRTKERAHNQTHTSFIHGWFGNGGWM